LIWGVLLTVTFLMLVDGIKAALSTGTASGGE